MYLRTLDIEPILRHKSLFLLGPRQTGKSTLLRSCLPDAFFVDLLEADTFRELSTRPELLRQTLPPQQRRIVIDEVQKLPALLDEVQLLIDRRPELRFVLTGSSARKLRRGGANLLAGRAWTCRLHPLVGPELAFERLDARLRRGGLPGVIDSPHPAEDLRAYVGTYLREEIQAEGLTRSIGPFARFVEVAGLANGEQVNFAAVASDCGVPARTVREYYQLLEDTLVGHLLPPFRGTKRRKPVATSKFYWFDVGVANTLARRGEFLDGSDAQGRALEHQVFLELRAFLDYGRRDLDLTYWRSQSQFEVDFVVGGCTGIEVKAKERVGDGDLKGLRALAEEVPLARRVVVSRERQRRRTDDGIEVMPAEAFLRELWEGALLGE